MNTKNLIYASLIGGAVIAVLSNIPIINLINCLLCAGVWIGAILAAYFYKRFEGSITLGQGAAVGALAGLWAGIIGFLVSLITISGATAVLSSLRNLLPPETQDLLLPGALGAFTVFTNLIEVLFTILFGTLGGLIGGAIFQSGQAQVTTIPSSVPIPPPSPAYTPVQVPAESRVEATVEPEPEMPQEESPEDEPPAEEPPASEPPRSG